MPNIEENNGFIEIEIPDEVGQILPVPTNIPTPDQVIGPPPEDPVSPLYRILFGTDHRNIFEAVAADIVDIIPFVGDVSNIARLTDAAARGGKYSKKKVIAQAIDAIGGTIPEPFSVIVDALTPTNTILYLQSRFEGR